MGRAPHRVYVRDTTDASVTLPAAQSHHLCRVLRLKADDEVRCFDGKGNVWAATITRAHRSQCEITRSGAIDTVPQPPVTLKLALAWLKSEAMDHGIQRAVEAGVTQITPIVTARCNISLNKDRQDARMAHWQRIIEASCTQCGQNHLPALEQPMALRDYQPATEHTFVLEPDRPPLPKDLARTSTAILIGPEGGWSEDELRSFEASGASLIGLGQLVFRAESAVLAACAALNQAWGWSATRQEIA